MHLAETRDDWMAGWAQDRHLDGKAGAHPRSAAQVVALADLDAALPAGTARVTRRSAAAYSTSGCAR